MATPAIRVKIVVGIFTAALLDDERGIGRELGGAIRRGSGGAIERSNQFFYLSILPVLNGKPVFPMRRGLRDILNNPFGILIFRLLQTPPPHSNSTQFKPPQKKSSRKTSKKPQKKLGQRLKAVVNLLKDSCKTSPKILKTKPCFWGSAFGSVTIQREVFKESKETAILLNFPRISRYSGDMIELARKQAHLTCYD